MCPRKVPVTIQERPQDLAQPILKDPARAAIFLVVTIREGHEAAVLDALADVPGLVRSVGFRVPENGLTCVVGVGDEAFDRLYHQPRPSGLHRLPAYSGAKHSMPSTPGDLLFHIRCATFDMCFELEHRILRRLGDDVEPVDEVFGFRYWDDRDLLGFVDGTENPDGLTAEKSVLVADGQWQGASYVVIQKYVHDMAAWDSLSVEQQELVIGRTKLEDIELADGVKPSNSHVAANTIEDADGTQHQIMRDNMPFGSPSEGEFGTFFIGYAADPAVTERMLERMFVGAPPGNHDRILDFSTALTGCLFFVPPADFLEDPDSFFPKGETDLDPNPTSRPTDPHESAVIAGAGGSDDGSLGLGDLSD